MGVRGGGEGQQNRVPGLGMCLWFSNTKYSSFEDAKQNFKYGSMNLGMQKNVIQECKGKIEEWEHAGRKSISGTTEQGPISAHHSSLISNVSNAEILQHKLLMTIHNCEISLNVKFLSIASFCENIS